VQRRLPGQEKLATLASLVISDDGIGMDAAVVSDAVMPRLSGRELLDAVSKDYPDMPFLFCSGFPARTISLTFSSRPTAPFW
jgi:FixJ family two-component response regulator